MTRAALRWALPVGLAAAVVGAVALGPQVRSWAADPPPEPDAATLLASLLTMDAQGVVGTAALRPDLGFPTIPGMPGDTGWLSLLTGDTTLRVWVDGASGFRVAAVETLAESDLVVAGGDVWLWSSSDASVTHLDASGLPTGSDAETGSGVAADPDPDADAESESGSGVDSGAGSLLTGLLGAGTIPFGDTLAELATTSQVAVGPSTTVAGRPAYQLDLFPLESGSLLSAVRVAIDAETSVPLRLQVFAADDGNQPALELAFTTVAFERPADGVVTFTPPPGSDVSEGFGDLAAGADPGTDAAAGTDGVSETGGVSELDGGTVIGTGWDAVVELPSAGLVGDGGTLDQLITMGQEVSGTWGSGHLLTTRLLSILATDDGRLLVGPVDGARLQEAAAESLTGTGGTG